MIWTHGVDLLPGTPVKETREGLPIWGTQVCVGHACCRWVGWMACTHFMLEGWLAWGAARIRVGMH